jgi:diguanylate cyclase (GGDEF)-like protein
VFFYLWSTFSLAFILLVTAVDGGAGSPLALLLILPSIYAGLAYPPPAVVAVACAGGIGYLAVAVAGPHAPTGEVVVLTGSLLCTGVTAAAVARSRERGYAALLAMHHMLQESAKRDPLTGCLTRAAFHEAVAAELARAERHRRATSLLMVDLDDFKGVNDGLGHLAGDALLERLGVLLRSSMRAGDEAGRLGGDEFAVVLAEAGGEEAAATAHRLLDALRERDIAASIGVATAGAGDDTAAILSRADAALYDAKRAGKDRVVIDSEGSASRLA